MAGDPEAPLCPGCHLKTVWYRSNRVSQIPLVIDHFFHCSDCGGVVQTHGGPTAPAEDKPLRYARSVMRR